MVAIFNYEELMADFNHRLVTQLRGHIADNEYLETWVPDEDPVKSLLNMVESGLSCGLAEMVVRFRSRTTNEIQRAELISSLNAVANVSIREVSDGFELSVSTAKS